MMIYKIFRASEWAGLQAAGSTLGAPVDLADGFIHFSTAEQVADTAAKHFAGVSGLMLAAVDPAALDVDLTWEISRGGAEFPHLYAPLPLSAVVWCRPMPWENDSHILPDGVA
ncbi:MAG TPA: DUF952 domain-containing protein [Aliiroseovarius sp.]|nr:DUF952 domain-containing protein [Aliiroseovarius sp.]